MDKILKIRVVSPVSIREKVYNVIRNDILNGRISPGERMVETRLAKLINTSRTPVREALHMLEREGLLESTPRVGYTVKKLKWDEVEEICEIRKVNESLAALWAIQRITARQLKNLEKNIKLSENTVRQGNPRAFVELDAEFHEILARASGSKRLLELCQMLRRHMLRYRIESIFGKENVVRAISGHKKIMDCIQRKDLKGIDKAIRAHIEQSKTDIRRYAFKDKGMP